MLDWLPRDSWIAVVNKILTFTIHRSDCFQKNSPNSILKIMLISVFKRCKLLRSQLKLHKLPYRSDVVVRSGYFKGYWYYLQMLIAKEYTQIMAGCLHIKILIAYVLQSCKVKQLMNIKLVFSAFYFITNSL